MYSLAKKKDKSRAFTSGEGRATSWLDGLSASEVFTLAEERGSVV